MSEHLNADMREVAKRLDAERRIRRVMALVMLECAVPVWPRIFSRPRPGVLMPTFNEIMRELWRADLPITESIEECRARLIARWPFLAAVLA